MNCVEQRTTNLSPLFTDATHEIFLQLIFDAKDPTRIVGCEVLIRGKDEGKTTSAPEVLGVSKRTGEMHELFLFTLLKACELRENLKGRVDDTFFVSVNVSFESLSHIDLPKEIMTLLNDLNISPHQIKFEILENAFDDDHSAIDAMFLNLFTLKDFPFVLDDYGTEHSNYARYLALDTLLSGIKLDKSVVQRKVENADSPYYIPPNAKQITAEGIKSALHKTASIALGADNLQGHDLHQPSPVEDALLLIIAQFTPPQIETSDQPIVSL